jgi:hypothetical protein
LAALSIMVEENFSSLGFYNEDKDVEGVMSFKDIRVKKKLFFFSLFI